MPPSITVRVTNGVPSAALTAGAHFVWVNPTAYEVTLTSCGGFCTQSSYTVAAQNGVAPGETVAQVNNNPTNWSFQESPAGTWAPGGPNPGMPHISNPARVPAEDAA
jgi:hypothetical protein